VGGRVAGSGRLEVAWHFLRGGSPERAATNAIEGAELLSTRARSPKQKKLWRSCFESELPNPLRSLSASCLPGPSLANRGLNLLRPFSPVYPVAARSPSASRL